MNKSKRQEIITKPKEHIGYLPGCTLGRLLQDCKKLIDIQSEEIEELSTSNAALTASERVYIERLRSASKKLKKLGAK